ncbi:MAG: AAA family ATPase [Chloroflexi bacterium]|nr:AAA family ATPase [Chloroflexota bacterium]
MSVDPNSSSSTDPLPLIGRQALVETILSSFEAAAQGGAAHIAVKGPSGMGKSRLIEEIVQHAEAQGSRVAFIACRPGPREDQLLARLALGLLAISPEQPPSEQVLHAERLLRDLDLEPLLEIIDSILNGDEVEMTDEHRRAPSKVEQMRQTQDQFDLDDTEADLDILEATEIAERPDDIPPTLRSVSTPVEALIEISEAVSKQAPLLLAFDDLDAATQQGLTMILSLTGRLYDLPVMVLGTFSEGFDVPPEFKDVLTLGALPHDGTLALANVRLGGAGLNSRLAERLWEHTSGHPLHVIMQVDHWRAVNVDTDDDAIERVPLLSLEDAFRAAFTRLDLGQRSTLVAAAVLGDKARITGLAAVQPDRTQDDVFNDLQSLIHTIWLSRYGVGRRATYQFRTQIMRLLTLDTLGVEKRKEIELKAGDYYAVSAPRKLNKVENALYHYQQAGTLDRALAMLDVVASQVRNAQTDSEDDQTRLTQLYERAIQLIDNNVDYRKHQAAYAEALGDIYTSREEYGLAVRAYSDYSPTISSTTLLSKLGLVLLAIDPSRAITVLERTIPATRPYEDRDLRWRLEAGIIWGLSLTGHHYAAIRRSRDLLGELGSTVSLGAARTLIRGTMGMALYYQGEREEASVHLESARAGWGARDYHEGVVFINQVLIDTPLRDITRLWLRMVLRPLLEQPIRTASPTDETRP